MNERIAALTQGIRSLEAELEVELARRRIELNYVVDNGKVRFEQVMIARHRAAKTRTLDYILTARPLMLVTAPLIYALMLPLLVMDGFISVYQAACFPVYGIPKVSRADYFIYDRSHLAYLNFIEKLNCAFCSYANGLIRYVGEISSRTEQYWCPIKHARRLTASHDRYGRFLDYGDAEAYVNGLAGVRDDLKKCAARDAPP